MYNSLNSVVAEADNGVKPTSWMGSRIASLSSSCIRDSSTSSLSLRDFSSSGHYTVYLDALVRYCNSPSLYLMDWINLETYDVLVPGPAVSVTPSAASFSESGVFTIT